MAATAVTFCQTDSAAPPLVQARQTDFFPLMVGDEAEEEKYLDFVAGLPHDGAAPSHGPAAQRGGGGGELPLPERHGARGPGRADDVHGDGPRGARPVDTPPPRRGGRRVGAPAGGVKAPPRPREQEEEQPGGGGGLQEQLAHDAADEAEREAKIHRAGPPSGRLRRPWRFPQWIRFVVWRFCAGARRVLNGRKLRSLWPGQASSSPSARPRRATARPRRAK